MNLVVLAVNAHMQAEQVQVDRADKSDPRPGRHPVGVVAPFLTPLLRRCLFARYRIPAAQNHGTEIFYTGRGLRGGGLHGAVKRLIASAAGFGVL